MEDPDIFRLQPVSPILEAGAYEELWMQEGQSFRKLAKKFRELGHGIVSDLVEEAAAISRAKEVLGVIEEKQVQDVNVSVESTFGFPEGFRSAGHPVHLLYYRGNLDLLCAPIRIAVVGTRNPSPSGVRRARAVAQKIVRDKGIVFSGLARGIDTAAHEAAINYGGKTVAVIGTPITEAYPKENARLQERIAREHLLVSQVPIIRHSQQYPRGNRFFFPQRNITMSALTQATVIVEAGETSGSLIQGRAALKQGRKLFIMNSCFRKGQGWPERLERQGAIRLSNYEQIHEHLGG